MSVAINRDDGIRSWGRAHRFEHRVARPHFDDEITAAVMALAAEGTVLARGLGRSYGDSALNAGGGLVAMEGLDRFVAFDDTTGVLEADAGVTFADVIGLLAARGGRWFLPVVPGTKFVTIGGAIANDVHGKNHHLAGCLGNHVLSFDLIRSDGSRLTCSPDEDEALFRATIGGLGLTGVIARARIRLKPIDGPLLETEYLRFAELDEFFTLAEQSEKAWEYTVAWVDTLASGKELGRGVFCRARHSKEVPRKAVRPTLEPRLAIPIDFPGFALNRMAVGGMNWLYRGRVSPAGRRYLSPFEPVLFPLDGIGSWNRIYGNRGFYQYQCVVPPAGSRAAMAELLTAIAAEGAASFLSVLKTFGEIRSPGILSFPEPGTTLALDFPNRGAPTLALLDRLDAITRAAGGRVYPAKDGRMSTETFATGYPDWPAFASHIDPRFSSSFWRRVAPGA